MQAQNLYLDGVYREPRDGPVLEDNGEDALLGDCDDFTRWKARGQSRDRYFGTFVNNA